MRHSVRAQGFGIRLRPVEMEDAEFIVWLRNLGHAAGKIGDTADLASQRSWQEEYFERPGDYYFIIETGNGVPVGTYSLWDVAEGAAESGRWIVRPEVPAAIPSAILGLDIAFKTLGLILVRVRTVSTNHEVLSLNRKFGMRETGIEAAARIIQGRPVDLVQFVLRPGDWFQARERLLPLAQFAEKRIRDWEAQAALIR